jgi:hypothetical protein
MADSEFVRWEGYQRRTVIDFKIMSSFCYIFYILYKI